MMDCEIEFFEVLGIDLSSGSLHVYNVAVRFRALSQGL